MGAPVVEDDPPSETPPEGRSEDDPSFGVPFEDDPPPGDGEAVPESESFFVLDPFAAERLSVA